MCWREQEKRDNGLVGKKKILKYVMYSIMEVVGRYSMQLEKVKEYNWRGQVGKMSRE